MLSHSHESQAELGIEVSLPTFGKAGDPFPEKHLHRDHDLFYLIRCKEAANTPWALEGKEKSI